jgi:hypothetical protein
MPSLLTLAVAGPTVLVVLALFMVLWSERVSARQSGIALVSGAVLALWAGIAISLTKQGTFRQAAGETSFPPIGINLIIVLTIVAMPLAASPSLRAMLSRQANLIRLHLWRFEGLVFLTLMAMGRVPALWALPAGTGDVLVAATAPWIARHIDTPHGKRRAITWNLLGVLDLVVAVALGVMTNPGAGQVFTTSPTSELLTEYPLALVPTFLVPLAFTIHVVSLLQLFRGSWARPAGDRVTHASAVGARFA